MNPNELQNALQLLNTSDLILTFWYVRAYWLRYKIGSLRPVNLLVPATLAQIVVFFIASFFPIEKFFILASIGNLIIIFIAMIPLYCTPRNAKIQNIS